MDAAIQETEANITTFVREIIVTHHPHRSRAKNNEPLPFWLGNERHAKLVIFLRTSNERLVFLRRIEGLDGARVSWKIAMITKVYGELIDFALTFNLTKKDGAQVYKVNSMLPTWMEEASYTALKERYSNMDE